ncbi:IclR family transcriptional regulator [Pigmentiphaga soli]|uniref:IclR family transcriptional regulator n=1 Tax=Pigmentiphaga soli TaxID=1007095 RepID=UPI0031ECA836
MKTEPLAAAPAARGPASDGGTVHRVLRILGCFAEKERWGLNELARALNLPRATTHRLLNLCRPLNFVAQDEDGSYCPGLELYRLAGRLSMEMPLNRIAGPILARVRDQTDETTILTLLVRSELKMFFALTASPSHPMRYTIQTNRLEPLTWGATGRALLAFLSPEEIGEAVRRAEPSPLDQRPLDEAELRRSLAGIRAAGHSVTHGQRTPNGVGLAVPFFDGRGEVRGNVALTIPEFRFDPDKQAWLLGLLREAAAELARKMGWT